MITLNGKNKYVMKAIEAAGHSVWTHDFVQYSTNDVAVQAIIDSFDALPDAKKDKIVELKAEGLKQIQLTFPSISNFDELDLVREQFLSIAAAARNATNDFQTLIDTVQAGKAAAIEINALNTLAEIEAYNVVTQPVWSV